ncbi:Hypothetical predicted protein [Mytilus galloprovincialis]|nr:Hypothetical predicted protein [Mytilus galloprovincialis]
MEGANEWMSLPANEKQLYDLFRSGKRHPAMEMADAAMKIKRSPNQVFLLLVGLRGSGKSSTVNYLFETNIARTSDSKSETRSTTEYMLQMKSNEWRIPDLTLSLIDTPGFGDTGGFAQDARNIMSIRYFLNSHPNLIQNNYPNLVMIIQSINDNRMEGESSSFAKMLKGLSQIDTIDHYNPNVVIVLTHATSIARNPKIWEERVKKKKEEVRAIVRLYLGIKPEIVVQENLPEENDLERDGDWYLLPNRDKQPKILYQACKRILDRAGDKLGHEAVAVGFIHGINKTVLKGFSILSSEVTSKDADKMHTILIQSIVQLSSSSEVGTMLENYKKKKNMTDLENDILILQVKFRDLHISNSSDLQTMTMNQLMSKFHPLKITSQMQKILGDVFGMHYKQ